MAKQIQKVTGRGLPATKLRLAKVKARIGKRKG